MFSSLPLVFFSIITRLFGLPWGESFFFHPDENNMAWAVGRVSLSNLNPQFFAYGHFPLYLVYFSYQVLRFVFSGMVFGEITFPLAVYLLRFWSAFFSLITLIIGWFLAKEVFGKKIWAKIYVLLLIFTPGLIQMAHFGTTESVLAFTAVGLAYFSLKFAKTKELRYLFLLSLISAVGLASKVSAALFLLSPALSILILENEEKKIKFLKKTKFLLFYGLTTIMLTFTFSPYTFLDWQESLRILSYESNVARGITSIFYTRQFINTRPVIFQLTKVFPWILGLPMFVLILFGLAFFFTRLIKRKISLNTKYLVLNAIFLPWLLFNAFLFTKWTRFMTPILPFLVLLVVWLLRELKKILKKQHFSILFYSFLFFSILPGILFMKLYFSLDIRIWANSWINKNLPKGSVILYEGGNIVDLPGIDGQKFKTVNIDFCHLDEDAQKTEELEKKIKEADYFLSPSRRIFTNYPRLPNEFPKTARFYQQLFSGELGFVPIKEFHPFGFLGELLLGSDLISEETWTVFDHPTIRLFKKI